MSARERIAPPRLALGPSEAAESIGVSRAFFDEQVLPEIKSVRRGRRILVSVREIEAWLARNERAVL